MANVPRAALGNLLAKLAIVGLGLAITVLVARMGPKVPGAFALFVAVESGRLTPFSGPGPWPMGSTSTSGHACSRPSLPCGPRFSS